MAIALVASTTGITTTVSLPVGWVEGDCHVVFAHTLAATHPVVPAGYTKFAEAVGGTSASGVLAYKILGASEPASTVWTGSGTPRNTSVVFSGVDAANPIGATASFGPASTNSVTIPALTCSVSDGTSRIVGVWGHRNISTSFVVGSITGVTTVVETLAPQAHRAYIGTMAEGATSFAGGSTNSSSSNQNHGIAFELLAASAGAVEITPIEITTAAPVLYAAALSALRLIMAGEITTAAAVIDAPALALLGQISPVDLDAGAAALDGPALGLIVALAPSDISTQAAVLDVPALSGIYAILPVDLEAAAPMFEAPSLNDGAVAITPLDIATGAPLLDAAALSGSFALLPDEITSAAPVFDTLALAAIYPLGPADILAVAALFEAPALERIGPDADLPPEPKYIVAGLWRAPPLATGQWRAPIVTAAYRATPIVPGTWSDAG